MREITNYTTVIPALGVGIGYRSELREGIFSNRDRIDFFVAHMPLSHLVQVHIAGGYQRGGWYVDGHSELVPPDIFSLFEYLVSLCQVKSVIFEHDAHFPPIADLLQQMDRARAIVRRQQRNDMPNECVSS